MHIELPVTLPEAALGASVNVQTIDGTVALKVPPASNTGSVLRLRGKGIPDRAGQRGDQYVRLKVMLPERIDPELKEFLEQWSVSHPYDVRGRSERR